MSSEERIELAIIIVFLALCLLAFVVRTAWMFVWRDYRAAQDRRELEHAHLAADRADQLRNARGE